jgi:hypothetical protein
MALTAWGSRIVRSLAVLIGAVAVVVLMAGTARATEPGLILTGEPTPEEEAAITAFWGQFAEAFAGFSDCMGPVEVKVVDRAEDWYGGRNVGSIAAFYRLPPVATVFVEHGKVNAPTILHEFAHHLDMSCGLGEEAAGAVFRTAQGIPETRGWLSGGSWKAVPAEAFAEAVVAYFEEETEIVIRPDAVDVIADLARVAEPEVREEQTRRVREAVTPLLRLSEGESMTVAPGHGIVAI